MKYNNYCPHGYCMFSIAYTISSMLYFTDLHTYQLHRSTADLRSRLYIKCGKVTAY